MALATQCPHCNTTFRVAHDQLKLRAGLVRCGACKQIFNGIENLLQPKELEQVAHPIAPASIVTEPTPESISAAAKTVPAADKQAEDFTPSASPHPPHQEAQDDPLLRMTLMDFTHGKRAPAKAPVTEMPASDVTDDLNQAIEDLESKPWRSTQQASAADELDQADAAAYEEPSFVTQGRRRQHISYVLEIIMIIGLPLLVLAMLAQATYLFRDQIAARLPKMRPPLVNACNRLGCQVGFPAQIDAVSIESSELQSIAPDSNIFSLTLLLRNHGAIVQSWPNIELTLTDAHDKAVARRVLEPSNYLPSVQDRKKGFLPKSEQAIKLGFELAQLKAAGYRVYVFYP